MHCFLGDIQLYFATTTYFWYQNLSHCCFSHRSIQAVIYFDSAILKDIHILTWSQVTGGYVEYNMDHVLPKGIQACSSQAVDPNGSPFIQPTIKVATTEEAVIDYEEIMPCDCPLAVDLFGNHAVQKVKFLQHNLICIY